MCSMGINNSGARMKNFWKHTAFVSHDTLGHWFSFLKKKMWLAYVRTLFVSHPLALCILLFPVHHSLSRFSIGFAYAVNWVRDKKTFILPMFMVLNLFSMPGARLDYIIAPISSTLTLGFFCTNGVVNIIRLSGYLA